MEPLSNKIFYVTGTSTGLGLSLCKKLISIDNYKVVAVTRNPENLKNQLPSEHLHNILIIKTDITNEESVKNSVDQAIETYGRIDVLVNNAASGLIGSTEELSDQEYKKAFDVNFFSVLHITRHIVPHMRKQMSGLILNVSSVLGWFTVGCYGAYNCTKYALNGLTYTLGQELEPFNIKCCIVSCSGFKTGFMDNLERAKLKIEGYKTEELAVWLDGIVNSARGDPDKFSDAIIALSNKQDPPKNIFLGTQAIHWMRDQFKGHIAEMEANVELSNSTDFPDAPKLE